MHAGTQKPLKHKQHRDQGKDPHNSLAKPELQGPFGQPAVVQWTVSRFESETPPGTDATLRGACLVWGKIPPSPG